MFNIEVRSDRVIIDGYVNAVGRDSRPVDTKTHGVVVEQIVPGTFAKAIQRATNVICLLDHNEDTVMASTADNTLTLREDSIGLRAHAEITNPIVIDKASKRELRGWSFGMIVKHDEIEQRAEGKPPRRLVDDVDLLEVSIIDNRMRPVYAGTSIEQRADDETTIITEHRAFDDEFDTKLVETPKKLDYSQYEKRIKDLAN